MTKTPVQLAQETLVFYQAQGTDAAAFNAWLRKEFYLVLQEILVGTVDMTMMPFIRLWPPHDNRPARLLYNGLFMRSTLNAVGVVAETFPGLHCERIDGTGGGFSISFLPEKFQVIRLMALSCYARGAQHEPMPDMDWRTCEAETWVQSLLSEFKPDMAVADFRHMCDTGIFSDDTDLVAWLMTPPCLNTAVSPLAMNF